MYKKYAKELVESFLYLWIVTSRMGFGKEPNPTWNDDLFAEYKTYEEALESTLQEALVLIKI